MWRATSGLLGAALALWAAGCQDQVGPARVGPGLSIQVAPLSLPGVTNARYRLQVANGSGEPIVDLELTADRYGDGAGSLSYVAPCDASDNDNTVTLTLLALYEGDAGTAEIDPATYVNPGPLPQSVTCRENADVLVSFDLTIARDAQQGFFDVAVTFEDVFCSAKLDCLAGDLLFNGQERDTTFVLGFACASGTGTDTWMYLDDVVISCVEGSATVDVGAGPGVLLAGDVATMGTSPLFGAAVYRGAEAFTDFDKQYWNVGLGFAGGSGCVLTARGTVAQAAFVGNATPAGAVYPYVDWHVELTDGDGALACGEERLGGADCPDEGTCVEYTTAATVTFAHVFQAAGLPGLACEPACVNGTCEGGVCACAPGWVGAACNQDEDGCLASPCYAGVTCTDAVAPATGFSCGPCPPDYSGDGQSCTHIDDCSPNPCLNGGTCTDGVEAYTCACPPTHTGTNCETVVNVDPDIASVTLLMHGEGANGSATFTDSSASNHSFTRLNDAQVSSAQAAFGASALYFDGSGDLIQSGPSAGFAFGTGDFTVETWYRRVSRPHPYPRIWQFGVSGSGGWNTTQHWSLADGHGDFAPTKFVLHVWAYQGNAAPLLVSQTTIAAGVWYHLAVTRQANVWRLFVNGVLEASATWAGAPDNGTSNYFVAGGANYNANDYAHGYLDEVRITKGVARYTADFTPPTAAFPDP